MGRRHRSNFRQRYRLPVKIHQEPKRKLITSYEGNLSGVIIKEFFKHPEKARWTPAKEKRFARLAKYLKRAKSGK